MGKATININIGIDLGMDSLKICYAGIETGAVVYGKLALDEFTTTLPGSGYYNEDADAWEFGEEIFEGFAATYERIVRIKDLLSLLNSDRTADQYQRSHRFNKFGSVETFECKNDTPRTIAEKFFKYAADNYLKTSLEGLAAAHPGYTFSHTCVLTYPYSADDRYKIELKRLLEKAGVAVTKMIPEPTSAALYARVINKNVKINQPALLVDIGESRISTAELIYLEKAIDITKYHPVVNIGGKDYDATVSAYLTAESRKQEEMTSYQKFILNQRIKTAKAALPIFKTVKVDYESDSTVQIPIDLPRFRELVRPVTAKICESVLKSLKTNAKIKYIILSGGCIQTAFLQQSIWDAVKAYRNDVAIITLETGLENTPDIFDIELDGSAFAVAAGAALYSTGKYKINAVCPRSYGICSLKNYQSDKREWMVVLIKKNSPLPAKFTQRFQTVAPTAAVNIHVLSSQMETDTLIGNDTQSILNGKLVFKQRVEANYPVEITINVDEDGIGTATAAADNGRNGKFVSSSFSLDATT